MTPEGEHLKTQKPGGGGSKGVPCSKKKKVRGSSKPKTIVELIKEIGRSRALPTRKEKRKSRGEENRRCAVL